VTSERYQDRDEIDGEKQAAGFRDHVKHIEMNDQLFLTRMMYDVDETE